MSIPVCTIDENGITAPTYADILAALKTAYQSIYGPDIYLEPDSQDGQLVAVFALALHDTNAAIIDAYRQFSPATAHGAGLSSMVKINGLRRLSSSNSTATVRVVGQAGTIIAGGIVSDGTHQWALPSAVVIPVSGQIDVLATCATPGSIAAGANTINQIVTPVRGWQTANNPAAATPGAPVETDAALRVRQSASTSLPAQSVLSSIVSSVANIAGVVAWKAYENDTGTTDTDGIPAHSISLVVDGGDPLAIAQAIARHKTPGTGTYGTTSEVVSDGYGPSVTINFYRPSQVEMTVQVALSALPGYVSTTGDAIVAALSSYISSLPIGADVLRSKLFAACEIAGLSDTYNVTGILIARGSGTPAASDVTIAFNEAADCPAASIALTVS